MKHILALALSLLAAAASAQIDIQTSTSPGGIDVWLVETGDIPFVALEIRIEGGASLDREGRRGAVNLMTGLLEEGSGDMDAQTFQTAREGLAATFGYAAYDDSIALSARFLTENADEAVALFRQSLVDPTFDDAAIERVRAQVLAGLRSDAQSPNAIASETLYAAAFGDHPYGSDLSGTPESVAALTREDIVQAWRDTLVRGRVHVGAVGDIDAAALGDLVDDLLGPLPATGPDLPPDTVFDVGGGVTVVDFPTPQAVALFGQPGIERDDDDFFAAYVLNHILGGGGFESRLMTEVREKRGLTYGVGTYLVPKDHAPIILGQVASANDRIGDAIAVIRDEWARIARDGVTQEELDAAKTYITGEYPLRFDGNGPIADILVGMQTTDLTPEYVTERNSFVEAVTLENVNRVAAELLRPDELRFVVVGQPEGLETGPLPDTAGTE